MVRTLPWLLKAPRAKKEAHSRSVPELPRKRQRVEHDTPVKSRKSQGPRRHGSRTPSTSPPPEPPMAEEMKEGDDEWIMVEDEFLTTAQSFTRHLHFKEYQRLKRLASNKTSGTLTAAQQQVDEEGDLRGNKKAPVTNKSAALDPDDGESDLETNHDLIIGDRNLAGLMHGTSTLKANDKPRLSSMFDATSKTRAAAGFNRQQVQNRAGRNAKKIIDVPGSAQYEERMAEVSDEDDLDAPVNSAPVNDKTTTTIAQSHSVQAGEHGSRNTAVPRRSPGPKDEADSKAALATDEATIVEKPEDPPSSSPSAPNQGLFHAKKAAPRQDVFNESIFTPSIGTASLSAWRKQKETKRKAKSTQKSEVNSIPTFLL